MSTISAIVITNEHKYELQRAIDSILSGDMRPQEIIIVDNSTSAEELDYSNNSEVNVSYIHVDAEEYNDYLSLREIGIKASSGDYIAFLDEYDIWENNKLAIISTYIENGFDIIAHSYMQQIITHLELFNSADLVENMGSAFCILMQYIIAPSSVVIKRNVAIAMDSMTLEELNKITISTVPDILSKHWSGAFKNVDSMEGYFWNVSKQTVKEMDLFHVAIDYCMMRYHKDEDKKTAFTKMITNGKFNSEEIAEIVSYQQNQIAYLENQINSYVANNNMMLKKKQDNYLVMRNWIESKLAGKKIEEYLCARGANKIAIYGAGKHGTLLYEELKASDKISVSYWIDQGLDKEIYNDLKVYKMTEIKDLLEEIDCIVVSPNIDIAEIVESLPNIDICLLADIVKDLCNG